MENSISPALLLRKKHVIGFEYVSGGREALDEFSVWKANTLEYEIYLFSPLKE